MSVLSRRKRPAGLTNLNTKGIEAENSFVLSETGTFSKGGFAISSKGITRSPMRKDAFSTLTLEQLEPLEALGSGASATVRLARDRVSGNLLALKIINVMADQSQRHQVLNELRVLTTIEHPQLVPLFDAFYLEGNVYLALGFMNGGSLLQLLTSYREVAAAAGVEALGLPESALAHITSQVLLGLAHLHSQGVVHRDLKPANILIDTGGGVRVSDFGISKRLETTFAASFVGTAAYMAPERIRGNDYSNSSDVWALGMIAMECVQGVHPYHHVASYYDLVLELSDGAPPPRLPPDAFSAPICDFVAATLSVQPERRPNTTSLLGHQFIVAHHATAAGSLEGSALAHLASARLGDWVSMTFGDHTPTDGGGGDDLMSDHDESSAALRIQAFLRGAQVRRELEEMRLLEEEFRGELSMHD